MSLYRIKLNGKIYEMEVELVEEGSAEEVKSVSPEPKATAPTQQSPKCDPNAVVAPMPGSIIQIVARPGNTVSADDTVLVIESMKMENEICAPTSGRIKAVYVSEGQVIAAGEPLFAMED